MKDTDYDRKVRDQISQYENVDIHNLPEIFHYWSNKYIRPRLNQVMGVDGIGEFYARPFSKAAATSGGRTRFASLGSGDSSIEVDVARRLITLGVTDFIFDCFELSPHLRERAQHNVREAALESHFRIVESDLNAWKPEALVYSGVMAHHTLHHLLNLEQVFSAVKASLAPRGVFVTNDMIGRNGHMRWPETLRYLEQIWAFLPERFKYNHQLRRLEEQFVNWDCSTEGFEGIRAQDILPLLNTHFGFRSFLAFGGIAEIFTDRSFGHNFDRKAAADCAFIDFIQTLNDLLIEHGEIKPTIMFAVMETSGGETARWRDWTPAFCARPVVA